MKDETLFWCHGDVHEFVESAQDFLNKAKPKKVVWLGDFFDRKGDLSGDLSLELATKFLVKTMTERKEDVFLKGNHDVAYWLGHEKYMWYGCTERRYRLFKSFWQEPLWDRFKIFEWVDLPNKESLVISHAGFSPEFTRAVIGTQKLTESSLRLYANAKEAQARRDPAGANALFDSPICPLWIRWPHLPFHEFNQIVGHTIQQEPNLRKHRDLSWNICADCARRFVLKVTRKGVYRVNKKTLDESLMQSF